VLKAKLTTYPCLMFLIGICLSMCIYNIFKMTKRSTLGLRLNVKCKAHEAENVFRCETHFYKWKKGQGMKPDDSQVHSHFESYIHAKIRNVYNLGLKRKLMSNLAPKTSLERS
jgi:hypothetical protein